MPGFIKDIGGSKRMRFTLPGTNPNNLALDPNLVVFDSDTIGNLNVLDYGQDVSVPAAGSNVNTVTTTRFRTWNLGYAPMVIGQIKLIDAPETDWANLYLTSIRRCYLESTPSGLWFVHGGTAGIQRLIVRWTAFRFPI